MMKKFGLLFILLIALMVGVFFLSPYYRLYQLKSAYETADYGQVSSYVNFDKVQANAKADLTARLDETMNKNNKLKSLTQLFPQLQDELVGKAKSEIDKTVNTAITPQNLEKLLKNEVSDDSKKLIAIWAFASDYVDYEILVKDMLLGGMEKAVKNQEPIVKKRVAERFGKPVPSDTKMSYCGLNCFEVMGSVSGQPVGAKLARVGLVDWQIEQVVLP